jgi:hypothetical protein
MPKTASLSRTGVEACGKPAPSLVVIAILRHRNAKGPPAEPAGLSKDEVDQACDVVLSSTGAPGPFFLIESMAFCALALLE